MRREANLRQKSISFRVASGETLIGGSYYFLFFLSASFSIVDGCSKISAIVSATSSIAVRPRTRQFYGSSESNIFKASVRLSKVEMFIGA